MILRTTRNSPSSVTSKRFHGPLPSPATSRHMSVTTATQRRAHAAALNGGYHLASWVAAALAATAIPVAAAILRPAG